MSKPTNAVKDRWNAKAYDDLRIRVPKGRKEDIELKAKEAGVSINSVVNEALRGFVGMSEEEWKQKDS